MAFLPAEAAWFRANTWAAHAHSGSQAHTSLGSPDPPFRGHSSSTGSLRTCSGKQKLPCHSEDCTISHRPHCLAAPSAPHRQCAKDRLGDRELGRGIFQGTLQGPGALCRPGSALAVP